MEGSASGGSATDPPAPHGGAVAAAHQHQQHHHQHHVGVGGGGDPPIHQLHATATTTAGSSPLSSPSMLLVPRDVPPGAVKQMPTDPAQATMYKLLGARLKCTLSDGRTATGTFICMDRLKNMIMMDVLEERMINPSDYDDGTVNKKDTADEEVKVKVAAVPVQRELSQAMIPGKHLVKVEIDKELFDKKMTNIKN